MRRREISQPGRRRSFIKAMFCSAAESFSEIINKKEIAMNYRVESLLSARLFLFPQTADGRIYFLSNLSGHLSLYTMNYGGSMPEPLLPPNIALQNPDLIGGYSYCVFPKIKKILVMIDHDGDENYQPMLIPIDGGFPEASFGNYFAERRDAPIQETYRANIKTDELIKMGDSPWGFFPAAYNKSHTQTLIGEGYTVGDGVLYQFKGDEHKLIYGKRLEDRAEGEVVPLNGIGSAEFAPSGKGTILTSAVFADTYSLGYINFSKPGELLQVKVKGIVHNGSGEMERIGHLVDDHYIAQYNIDGCSWVYEGVFNEDMLEINYKHVLVGRKPLNNGKLEHIDYDEDADLFTITFSTATSPTQIYTVEGKSRNKIVLHTNEKILGIPRQHLSAGEDASFTSHDGLRVSARLYFPAKALGFTGPRPVVYYIHGGP